MDNNWKVIYSKTQGGHKPTPISIIHGVDYDTDLCHVLNVDSHGSLIISNPLGKSYIIQDGDLGAGDVSNELSLGELSYINIQVETSNTSYVGKLLIEATITDEPLTYFETGIQVQVNMSNRGLTKLIGAKTELMIKGYNKIRVLNDSLNELTECKIRITGF